MAPPSVVLIRGLPGAGKTTYAKQAYPTYSYLDADSFFYNDQGVYSFDPSRAQDAHQACMEKARALVLQQTNVVIANTFVTKGSIEEYINCIGRNVAVNFSVIHITGRAFTSVHNVPQHRITRFQKMWETYPGEIRKEPTPIQPNLDDDDDDDVDLRTVNADLAKHIQSLEAKLDACNRKLDIVREFFLAQTADPVYSKLIVRLLEL
jgi:hypothetical protein